MDSNTFERNESGIDVFSEESQIILERAGFPSYEEFKKNPDKFRSRKDDLLASADQGSVDLRALVSRYRYEMNGYSCDSLEQVERIARDEGLEITDLEMKPEIIPIGAGKCDILVRFVKKQSPILSC